MADEADTHVIGVDPASGKGLCFFNGERYSSKHEILPVDSRHWIEDEFATHRRVLLTWDAPISFNCTHSLTTRPIERTHSPVAIWVREQVQEGRIAKKAVAIGRFSDLPHWVISCHCLGMPYGVSPKGLRIASHRDEVIRSDESMRWVIEVHPAVSMALWWVGMNMKGALPKYKGNKPAAQNHLAREAIWASFLDKGLASKDTEPPADDDQLDAWVAWKMGVDFLSGEACWVGTPESGGFVLPTEESGMFGLVEAMSNFIQRA